MKLGNFTHPARSGLRQHVAWLGHAASHHGNSPDVFAARRAPPARHGGDARQLNHPMKTTRTGLPPPRRQRRPLPARENQGADLLAPVVPGADPRITSITMLSTKGAPESVGAANSSGSNSWMDSQWLMRRASELGGHAQLTFDLWASYPGHCS